MIEHSKKYFKRTQRKYVSNEDPGVSASESFEIHRKKFDPSFSHSIEEVVILAEGQIDIQVAGVIHRPVIGEEIFIPAQAIHTVRNFGTVSNVWYYGYRVA